MKKKIFQGGFAPFLVIAIVAVLAVGGGAYVVTKNKQAKVEVENNVDTQANATVDQNTNTNANLGVNANINAKTKGSFRSLMALGKSAQCTFASTQNGVTSSGTVFIASNGNMRGDFTSKTSSGVQTSNMILKDGYSYVWSGNQGAKMNVENMGASSNESAGASAKQSVDLDAQVDYECKDWTADSSKFIPPSSVKFLDIEAMMKGSGGVNIDSMIKGSSN